MKNTIEILIDRLGSEKVHFKFTKIDGTIREALGTTNPELLPLEAKRGGDRKTPKTGVVNFYDFIADGWRCFQKSSDIIILE